MHFILYFLLSITLTLNANWMNNLSHISDSQSVKKSYLKGILSNSSYGAYKVDKLRSKLMVHSLYEKNGYELYWFDESRELNYTIVKMIDAIKLASNEGLEPSRYHYIEIQELYKDLIGGLLSDSKDFNLASTNMDVLLSDAFFTLTKDLSSGQIDYVGFEKLLLNKSKKDNVKYTWNMGVKNHDFFQLLDELKQNGNIIEGIYELVSNNIIYKKLRNAYNHYKFIEDFGGFQKIKSGPNLKYGSKSKRVIDLSIRLNQSEDLRQFDQNNTKFNKNIKNALKRFQKRVGIYPSGILNSTSIKALNIPISKRIKQIKINLERSRIEKDSLDYRHFFINIPEFKMRFKDGDELLLESAVIVGKRKNPTPIFQSLMSHVVLNPKWNVPNSIIVNEFLQKVQEDPFYFEDRDYKIYDGWKRDRREIDTFEVDWFSYDENSTLPFSIVKQPGLKNPLGNIKFMFPNQYAVYMHDTPTKYLFKKPVRSFSHGCIRLQNPQKLLEFISLGYIEKSFDTLKKELDTGKNLFLNFKEKIPVYVRYYTVYVDESGGLNFSKDIYGYDKIYQKLFNNDN